MLKNQEIRRSRFYNNLSVSRIHTINNNVCVSIYNNINSIIDRIKYKKNNISDKIFF